ncbi:hypothetical protein V6N13_130501 [Hibiscus sabdariffa]|uniref:Uncharacterized protein n=2 Tax=Hibiscus sabdariffa TaxID=183260 RepID=A0ABR1ZGD0_9ROSI
MKREDMDEMISGGGPNNQSNEASTRTTWKVYDNPFYCSLHQQLWLRSKRLHHQINFPVSAQNIVDPFCDLTPVMDSDLDIARAHIIDLQAELEHELGARKKAESFNKKLAKELDEQRRGREALERVCDKLAREVSMDKAEIDKMKRDFEEERKMLRMAEVIREERVQMKMAEAKILFQEKLLELEETKRQVPPADEEDKLSPFNADLSGKSSVLSEKCSSSKAGYNEKSSTCNDNIKIRCSTGVTQSSSMGNQRKASPGTENQHIKRGIKGFAEFPRVVRAIGSKARHWGSKQECQMAQLSILLKQKSPIPSNSPIIS